MIAELELNTPATRPTSKLSTQTLRQVAAGLILELAADEELLTGPAAKMFDERAEDELAYMRSFPRLYAAIELARELEKGDDLSRALGTALQLLVCTTEQAATAQMEAALAGLDDEPTL